MKDKKLRKKAMKLAKWAKRHGYEYACINTVRADKGCWYLEMTVRRIGSKTENVSGTYWKEDEQ